MRPKKKLQPQNHIFAPQPPPVYQPYIENVVFNQPIQAPINMEQDVEKIRQWIAQMNNKPAGLDLETPFGPVAKEIDHLAAFADDGTEENLFEDGLEVSGRN
jgi:hypothetical protein